MSKRKDRSLIKFGNVIREQRENLTLKSNSRSYFLDDRIEKGLLKEGDISEKSLINIENGYNLPSLSTLKILSVALEVDFFELLEKLYDYIPIEK